MSKLSVKIFKGILTVSVVILSAALILISGVLYSYYSEQHADALKSEAGCIKAAVDAGGNGFLSSMKTDHRITLIDSDGTVIYDSVTDAATLENHAERAEVADALKNGSGFCERYSNTVSEKTLNAAVLLADGTVLRVSDTVYTVFSLFVKYLWPVILIYAAAILFSSLLASKMSRVITAPINKIDLENPSDSDIYSELSPLAKKITAQNEQIAKQLSDMREEHKNQDDMRRDFTANVSHELKTPLTSISGYAEIMKNGIAKPEDIVRFSGKIYDESQRMITLVGDIIRLSQLDGSNISVKPEEIDLYSLCEQIISQLEKAASDKNVTFSLLGEHLKLFAARQIVEEIVGNICDNAVKYNREGGKVDISLRQCVDGIELTVSDTGIGIPKADIDRIFERFFRVDKSHSKDIGGTGLGLSIVKHGVKHLGASVSVESTVGKGTDVHILF